MENPTLRAGQHVTISGAAGICAGEVIRSETPATLPDLRSPAPAVARAREIMEEWGIVEVAMIEHLHDGRPAMFAALRDNAGRWRDLRDRPITITLLHGLWEAT